MCNKKLLFLFMFLTLLLNTNNIYPISAIVTSKKDYNFLMNQLRNVQIIIDNFANKEQKDNFEQIKNEFQASSVEYYAHNFIQLDKKSKYYKRTRFYKINLNLSNLLEDMAKIYLKRTEKILRTVAKESFSILIKFTKGGYTKYFTRPVNPISRFDKDKIYKTDEYHLYHDKDYIENYLKKGYKIFQDAKLLFTHPDLELIKKKKDKNRNDISYLIQNYSNVISQCRLAKQYGIEIFKIIRSNNLTLIHRKLEKYNISTKSPEPIFDVRIPEKYKVDANDNIKLIHSHELKKVPDDFPQGLLDMNGTKKEKK